MSLERVIAVAEGELGKTEWPPDSNNILYNTEYYGRPVSGSQYKWCVSGLWWVYKHADEESAFFGGGRTASCGTLLRWHREMGQTVPVLQIKRGDIAILNFSGTLDTEHCGLVTEVGWISHGTVGWVRTIEGNTSKSGSQSNGEEVCEKTRYPSQIVAVCRPHYKPKEEPMKDDITGHWAADDIRWCMERGILKGYPDGSFQPDQPVTRAEMAVICKRLYAYTVEADITGLREDIARLKDAR